MLNVGDPRNAFRLAALPSAGVGLARIEFIVSSWIGVHPMALLHRSASILRSPARSATTSRHTAAISAMIAGRLSQGTLNAMSLAPKRIAT